jgi:hypothetical protein
MDRLRSNSKLIILLACLFVVMTGYGVLLPVLPFFIERLADYIAGGILVVTALIQFINLKSKKNEKS